MEIIDSLRKSIFINFNETGLHFISRSYFCLKSFLILPIAEFWQTFVAL